jgi:hypothetical protein
MPRLLVPTDGVTCSAAGGDELLGAVKKRAAAAAIAAPPTTNVTVETVASVEAVL